MRADYLPDTVLGIYNTEVNKTDPNPRIIKWGITHFNEVSHNKNGNSNM